LPPIAILRGCATGTLGMSITRMPFSKLALIWSSLTSPGSWTLRVKLP